MHASSEDGSTNLGSTAMWCNVAYTHTIPTKSNSTLSTCRNAPLRAKFGCSALVKRRWIGYNVESSRILTTIFVRFLVSVSNLHTILYCRLRSIQSRIRHDQCRRRRFLAAAATEIVKTALKSSKLCHLSCAILLMILTSHGTSSSCDINIFINYQ